MKIEIWIAAVGCFLTAVTLLVTLVWKLSRVEIAIIDKVQKEIDKENTQLRHEVGETLKAIKAHVERYETNFNQMQLYIRDNYTEFSTFNDTIRDIKSTIKEIFNRLEGVKRH